MVAPQYGHLHPCSIYNLYFLKFLPWSWRAASFASRLRLFSRSIREMSSGDIFNSRPISKCILSGVPYRRTIALNTWRNWDNVRRTTGDVKRLPRTAQFILRNSPSATLHLESIKDVPVLRWSQLFNSQAWLYVFPARICGINLYNASSDKFIKPELVIDDIASACSGNIVDTAARISLGVFLVASIS